MGYDRYPRNNRDDRWNGRIDGDDYTGYDYGGDTGRSSAREYVAAGQYGRGRDDYRDREQGRRDYYGVQSGRDEGRFGGRGWDRDQDRSYGGFSSSQRSDRGNDYRGGDWGDHRRTQSQGNRGGYDRRPEGYSYQDRDFFSRAGDEVRSWFGDEEAERRREYDARYDAREGDGWGRSSSRRDDRDDHYHGWRSRQIADFDRDYDEYRRENATKFENEFATWRTERQGQRTSLSRVAEHMEVVGSDGQHVGTVDKVRGDRIVLTKNDADAGGHHHSIPSRWIQSVDDKVTIRKTADEAKSAWKDEERSGALFGEQDDQRGARYLNRSFSGTY
ncbi:DUF2171 domain-containing protein [Sphingomonas turrisvirgatae]|uniref:DUF2171 domain-containing protein n=1 Tax=Sphingomonas turrisvirgatae TaxID=1888892 RepID=UPI000AA9FB16|nr:DUF2171 domain-containing protein [Sphingomonas turrisvirgatae]